MLSKSVEYHFTILSSSYSKLYSNFVPNVSQYNNSKLHRCGDGGYQARISGNQFRLVGCFLQALALGTAPTYCDSSCVDLII